MAGWKIQVPWMIPKGSNMGENKAAEKHVCQRCGREWPEMYCSTCTILIQAEALEERGGILGGKTGSGPPTVEIAHLKRS